jgi:hypothetical protein
VKKAEKDLERKNLKGFLTGKDAAFVNTNADNNGLWWWP